MHRDRRHLTARAKPGKGRNPGGNFPEETEMSVHNFFGITRATSATEDGYDLVQVYERSGSIAAFTMPSGTGQQIADAFNAAVQSATVRVHPGILPTHAGAAE